VTDSWWEKLRWLLTVRTHVFMCWAWNFDWDVL